MRSDSGFEFFIGGTTENVETQIVPHDSTEKLGIGAAAIVRMFSWIICRRLNGRPWRNPKRVHTGFLIEDLCNVAAFLEHCHAQIVVLDERGPAATESGLRLTPLVPTAAYWPISERRRSPDR